MMIAAAAAANTSIGGGIVPSGRVAGSGGGVGEGGINLGDLREDSGVDQLLLEQRLAGELTLR